MQISLRSLLVFVSLFALGCVALLSPSTLLESSIASITFVMYSVLLCLAVYRDGPARAFCIGFLAFSMPYAVLTVVMKGVDSHWLLSTNALDELHSLLHQVAMDLKSVTRQQRFLTIGHCVFGWLLGLSGGRFAMYLQATTAFAEPASPRRER